MEQIASATGIAREARRMMKQSGEDSAMRKFGDRISAKNVLDCAKAGDKLAMEVMETVPIIWAGRCNCVHDGRSGGVCYRRGVSKAGTFLTDMIRKYYEEYTPISENKAGIELATLGNDAELTAQRG